MSHAFFIFWLMLVIFILCAQNALAYRFQDYLRESHIEPYQEQLLSEDLSSHRDGRFHHSPSHWDQHSQESIQSHGFQMVWDGVQVSESSWVRDLRTQSETDDDLRGPKLNAIPIHPSIAFTKVFANSMETTVSSTKMTALASSMADSIATSAPYEEFYHHANQSLTINGTIVALQARVTFFEDTVQVMPLIRSSSIALPSPLQVRLEIESGLLHETQVLGDYVTFYRVYWRNQFTSDPWQELLPYYSLGNHSSFAMDPLVISPPNEYIDLDLVFRIDVVHRELGNEEILSEGFEPIQFEKTLQILKRAPAPILSYADEKKKLLTITNRASSLSGGDPSWIYYSFNHTAFEALFPMRPQNQSLSCFASDRACLVSFNPYAIPVASGLSHVYVVQAGGDTYWSTETTFSLDHSPDTSKKYHVNTTFWSKREEKNRIAGQSAIESQYSVFQIPIVLQIAFLIALIMGIIMGLCVSCTVIEEGFYVFFVEPFYLIGELRRKQERSAVSEDDESASEISDEDANHYIKPFDFREDISSDLYI